MYMHAGMLRNCGNRRSSGIEREACTLLIWRMGLDAFMLFVICITCYCVVVEAFLKSILYKSCVFYRNGDPWVVLF